MKNLFYGFAILFLFIQCSIFDSSYYSDYEETSIQEPIIEELSSAKEAKPKMDICYAKCSIPYGYEKLKSSYLKYTGETPNIDGVSSGKVVLTEGSTKWVKKKADKHCLSANPDDCLVWCLVKIPEIADYYWVVTDPSLVLDFEVTEIEELEVMKSSGRTELTKVVCDYDITTKLIEKIHSYLTELGYVTGAFSGEFTNHLKESLNEYQKKFHLPIGVINFKTLEHMGIEGFID